MTPEEIVARKISSWPLRLNGFEKGGIYSDAAKLRWREQANSDAADLLTALSNAGFVVVPREERAWL